MNIPNPSLQTPVQPPKALTIDPVITLFKNKRNTLTSLLPKDVDPNRLINIIGNEVSRNHKLLQCTPSSVLSSTIMAVQLGLDVGHASGQSYLIPFKQTCTFILGYKGMIRLLYRGSNATVCAHAVFQNDEFDHQYGTDPYIHHKPAPENRGPFTHAYAVCKKFEEFKVLSKETIDGIKKNTDIWRDRYNEMAKKTAIRALCKYLPMNAEIQKAIHYDEMGEAGNQGEVFGKILDPEMPPTPNEQDRNALGV